MNKMNFLLQDEESISSRDLEIRTQLYDRFMNLPKEFVSKMRHLQPQVGCFNNCGFCSKFSVCKSEYWDEESLRNAGWETQKELVKKIFFSVFPYMKNHPGGNE